MWSAVRLCLVPFFVFTVPVHGYEACLPRSEVFVFCLCLVFFFFFFFYFYFYTHCPYSLVSLDSISFETAIFFSFHLRLFVFVHIYPILLSFVSFVFSLLFPLYSFICRSWRWIQDGYTAGGKRISRTEIKSVFHFGRHSRAACRLCVGHRGRLAMLYLAESSLSRHLLLTFELLIMFIL